MKKYLIILILLIAIPCFGADTKISGLTEDTAPTSDDLVPTVDAPGSSPANKKSTLGNLVKWFFVPGGSTNVTTITGNYSFGITLTGNTAVTFPTSGTLMTNTDNTSGNASTATALASDPSDCAALGLATAIDASGNLTCGYAIGTDVQAYDAQLDVVAAGGSNNTLFGINNSGEYGYYANHTHDDSAAQFYSATASKGTRKLVQSSISDGILLTDTPVVTGNVTWTNVSQGAGTYNRVFLETDNAFTGANTIGDGGDDQRIVSRINATNERWSGHTIYFAKCAATLAFGTPVYIQSTGKPGAADADAAATMPAIGLIVVASTDADTPCTVLTHGVITDTDWNFTTVGATIYTSETAGSVELDVANISDTNDVVQVLGIALHADTLFVSPSLVTIVLE